MISLNLRNLQRSKFEDYIELHYSSEKLYAQQVASFMGMSRTTLYRFLKKEGIDFVIYVNKLRIEHAATLLKTTHEDVSAIGYACGFNNVNYFIKLFKEEKGITPGKYTKRLD